MSREWQVVVILRSKSSSYRSHLNMFDQGMKRRSLDLLSKNSVISCEIIYCQLSRRRRRQLLHIDTHKSLEKNFSSHCM